MKPCSDFFGQVDETDDGEQVDDSDWKSKITYTDT